MLFKPNDTKNEYIIDKNKRKELFYIQGQGFLFIKQKHSVDTLSINFLKKINLSNASKLVYEEFEFHKERIREIKDWKKKAYGPIPLTRLHLYFKVFVLKKYKDKIIKYEVDWDYSGTRGLRGK